jgi:hypothetical protein
MRKPVPAADNVPHGRERRRFKRFPVFNRVLGVLTNADLPVRIRDVSLGGCAVETPEPLPADAKQPIRFIADDDWSVVLDTRSVYSHPSVSDQGAPMYVTGFSFVGYEDAAKEPVAQLLEKVTSVRMPFE